MSATAVLPAPSFARYRRGFTLTEMAVVLAIVALLVGGMLLPLTAQRDMRDADDTRRLLAAVGEALAGYAAGHAAGDGKPYLPCPDTDGDGVENRAGNACANPEGTLPWADLGLGRQDVWGNPLRYRVAAAFSNSAAGFALLSTGDLRVCETSACAVTLGAALPAVIVSTGKNGAAATTQADELENLDGDADFVLRAPGGTTGYDDLVVWLPQGILLNRMIAAGRLP